MTSDNIHPLFGSILAWHGVAPAKAITEMQKILTVNLAALNGAESRIEDLQTDLRDAPHFAAEFKATAALAKARAERDQLVTQAARDLRTIEKLRERAGLEPIALSRVIAEYNRGRE